MAKSGRGQDERYRDKTTGRGQTIGRRIRLHIVTYPHKWPSFIEGCRHCGQLNPDYPCATPLAQIVRAAIWDWAVPSHSFRRRSVQVVSRVYRHNPDFRIASRERIPLWLLYSYWGWLTVDPGEWCRILSIKRAVAAAQALILSIAEQLKSLVSYDRSLASMCDIQYTTNIDNGLTQRDQHIPLNVSPETSSWIMLSKYVRLEVPSHSPATIDQLPNIIIGIFVTP